MKKAKKIISLCLSAVIAVGLMAGCTSNAQGNAESNPPKKDMGSSQLSSGAAPELSKDVKIQVILPNNWQEFPEGVTENKNLIVDYWKKETGYDFDVVLLPLDAPEKMNIMFTSGEVEGMAFSKDTTLGQLLGKQNVLAPLDEYKASSKFFQKFEEVQLLGQYDGKQYSAVIPPDGIQAQGAAVYVRKDVMSKNGFAQQPKTFEEFNKLLEMFKAQGMMPLAVGGTPTGKAFDLPLALFDIASDYTIRDNKIAYPFILPEAKEYLIYMNGLYKQGLIPQDFSALNEAAVNELYLAGKAGMAVNLAAWQGSTIIPQSEELGYTTRLLDYPTGHKGEKAYGMMGNPGASEIVLFAKNCKYLPQAIDFLDFLTEPETIRITNFGIEGEHYTLNDGVPTPTEKASELAWGVFFRNIFLPEDWYSVYGIGSKWAEYYYPTERHTVGMPTVNPVPYLPADVEKIKVISTLRGELTDTFFTKVITGVTDIEQFDSYVKDFLSSGGQDTLDYLNDLWKQYGSPTYECKSFLPAEHLAYTGKYTFDEKL